MLRARWIVGASLILACGRGKAPPAAAVDGGAAVEAGPSSLPAIARAEDDRRVDEVPDAARTDHDVTVRRRLARALARIGDPASEGALLRALNDEDPETNGWAAYGLGWTCKGHEEARVRALAARGASLGDGGAEGGPGEPDLAARDAIDVRMAVARAVGRCGGPLAEQVLAGWVKTQGPWTERAVLALGDIAGHAGQLGDETLTALVDAASAKPPLDAALYPFARMKRVDDAFAPRVAAAARAALGRPTSSRAFAIRALARTGREAEPDLVRFVESQDMPAAERAEAARALTLLGEPGKLGIADALARLTPDKDPLAITGLGGDEFGVLDALVTGLGSDAPKSAEPALYALAALRPPGEVPPSLARRLAELRCAAAGALSRGAYDSDLLAKCDRDATSEEAERPRLAALAHRPVAGERRAAWRALTRSPHVRIREAALEVLGEHVELAEVAPGVLAEALASDKAGVVTTAADVIHAHPERVLALAEKERRAALDPNVPAPTRAPAREVDPALAQALSAALAKPWAEDLVETRTALLDAAVAVHLPAAHDAAVRACHDPNVTIREHGAKALRAEGDLATTCSAKDAQGAGDAGAPRVDPPLAHPTKVTFETDAGDLAVVFEPELTPLAAARFVALARGGFYKGIVVHRVVHGYVVQLGDPGGDGYGGSGALLRCETSPVPFARLDVGVALAGRDTGSSQLFVALGRVPHLDGEYARIGHAIGDWDAVAEGDVVREVKVEE